eukprot:9905-Prorocentrum_minimum.AAC.2
MFIIIPSQPPTVRTIVAAGTPGDPGRGGRQGTCPALGSWEDRPPAAYKSDTHIVAAGTPGDPSRSAWGDPQTPDATRGQGNFLPHRTFTLCDFMARLPKGTGNEDSHSSCAWQQGLGPKPPWGGNTSPHIPPRLPIVRLGVHPAHAPRAHGVEADGARRSVPLRRAADVARLAPAGLVAPQAAIVVPRDEVM